MAAPFLTYLTVFKSRLGIANILLGLTGLAHQPEQTLARKVRRVLEERVDLELDGESSSQIFSYLYDKRVIGSQLRQSGRYAGYSLTHADGEWSARRKGTTIDSLPVFRTDIWMSDPAVPSTIGVPTPDNAGETVELGFQLGLLSRHKNTWTAGGQFVSALRGVGPHDATPEDNPFLLGLEAVGLLRQILAADGIILRELLRWLSNAGAQVSRDEVAAAFSEIVDLAYDAIRQLGVASPSLSDARQFRDLIRKTTNQAAAGSGGPGVLEHRVSPRLEWLTDLGYLSKEGLQKNSFQYRVTPSVTLLLADLDERFGEDRWANDIAVHQWQVNPSWTRLRAEHARLTPKKAFGEAYRRMQRRIGPAPLPEVAFVTCLLRDDGPAYRTVVDEIIEYAREAEGISVSGGRYRRSAENIYMSDAALASID